MSIDKQNKRIIYGAIIFAAIVAFTVITHRNSSVFEKVVMGVTVYTGIIFHWLVIVTFVWNE